MSLSARIALERPSFALDLALEAGDGEVVGLLGPNGSGKSTTLRCLAGLEAGTRGRIVIGGDPVQDSAAALDLPPERRPIGMVFQDYLLFPHLSVLDNVAFGSRSRGQRRAYADAVAREWLARLDIADLASRRPGTLSGGQAQRVALARALATDPRLLLLDEPLAALDAETRATTRSLLRSHLRARDRVVVIVTHDPVDAMVLADRVVVLEDGRAVQEGTPADIARRPSSAYVAELVGVNLLRGRAAGGEVALADGGALSIADHGLAGPVIVAIRPQAVSVHRGRPEGSPRNVWQGRVRGLEARGEVVRIDVDATPPIAAMVTPSAVADLGLHEGAPVWVSLKATDLDAYPA